MFNLIRLELRKNSLTPYYLAILITTILLTIFIYLIPIIANAEGDVEFQSYTTILKLHSGFAFMIFSVFSVVLFSRFAIEDYKAKKAILMFSYPVPRSKIFAAKSLIVVCLTSAGFLISTLTPSIIFFISERIFPVLDGAITTEIIHSQLLRLLCTILSIISISFISLRVGFKHKSISTTIVTALILSTMVGNFLMGLDSNFYTLTAVIVFFITGILFGVSTNKVIAKMEV